MRPLALLLPALVQAEEHRIDDLVVVDDDRRPVGMIDTQDLTRHRVV